MSSRCARLVSTRAALILLALAVPSAAWAQTTPPIASGDPRKLIEGALADHQAGRFAEAIAGYQAFLELQPRNVDIRSNLGAALAHEGRYADAIAEYRKALSVDPGRVQVRFNLALSLYKAFEIADAATELETVVTAQPDNPNARLLLADCHLRKGAFKKVVETLQPVEPTADRDRAVAYLLGMALVLDDQAARGQVYIDHILRNGDSAEARLLMGVTRLMASEPAAARDDFARAVELDPRLPSAQGNLGQALMQLGDPDQAAAAFEKELQGNPNDYDANLYLGVMLRQRQQYPEAMAKFRRALSVRPSSAAARYQVGSLHLVLGEIDEARRVLETVVEAEPSFVEAHVSLATVYYRLKRKEDGDRERAIVKELNKEIQATQPGAKPELGPAYRGDGKPGAPEPVVRKPEDGPPRSR